MGEHYNKFEQSSPEEAFDRLLNHYPGAKPKKITKTSVTQVLRSFSKPARTLSEDVAECIASSLLLLPDLCLISAKDQTAPKISSF